MRWVSAGALAAIVCFAGARPARAQAGMKDDMAKDTVMAKDAMGHDEMGKDMMGKGAMAMAPHGAFSGMDGHKALGSFEVVTVSGASELRLGKDFSVDKGPDVYVVLSKGVKGGPTGLSLGKLKRFSGEQTLAIPAGTDLAAYSHVVLWCRKYDATMGAAPLASGEGMMHK
jgi:pentapeptide MXKDX repeat protein